MGIQLPSVPPTRQLIAGANVTVNGGASATLAGNVTIAASGGGGGAIAVDENGSPVVASANTLNFTGAGVAVTDGGGGQANIAISGGGGGSGAMVLLSAAAITPGAANIDFTGLDTTTYESFRIIGRGIYFDTDWANCLFECSTNNGVSYDTGGNYNYQSVTVHQATSDPNGYNAASNFLIPGCGTGGNAATKGGSFIADFLNFGDSAGYKYAFGRYGGFGGDASYYSQQFAGVYRNNAVVNALRLAANGGLFSGGHISLYGIT